MGEPIATYIEKTRDTGTSNDEAICEFFNERSGDQDRAVELVVASAVEQISSVYFPDSQVSYFQRYELGIMKALGIDLNDIVQVGTDGSVSTSPVEEIYTSPDIHALCTIHVHDYIEGSSLRSLETDQENFLEVFRKLGVSWEFFQFVEAAVSVYRREEISQDVLDDLSNIYVATVAFCGAMPVQEK